MTRTLEPLGERLLVLRLAKEDTIGELGIIHVPEAAQETPKEGIVIAVGTKDTHVKEGQHILFAPYAGEQSDSTDENLIFITYSDVVAIVHQKVTDDVELEPGQDYLIAERVCRREKSSGGIVVPRRTQEETDGAVVIDPGDEGKKEGIKAGDTILVRQHCGIDFQVGGFNLTAFKISNDEVFGLLPEGINLDERNH